MNRDELQDYLHDRIPLSAAMEVAVLVAGPERVELHAPLAPNINHRGTAFGGSIATLTTLACWSLLRLRTDGLEPAPHLVVHRSNMEYSAPIAGAFTAVACFPPTADWQDFLHHYLEWHRARITLDAYVLSGTQIAARFTGEFVALGPTRTTEQ